MGQTGELRGVFLLLWPTSPHLECPLSCLHLGRPFSPHIFSPTLHPAPAVPQPRGPGVLDVEKVWDDRRELGGIWVSRAWWEGRKAKTRAGGLEEQDGSGD